MNKIYGSLLLGLALIAFSGYGQGIAFSEGTWADILNKAKEERKPIFVDAYTVWCGPCKKMSKEVFTQTSVGAYFNETFVSYKMDMEKGEGIAFAKKYDVSAFPTFLYFDKNGELLNRSIGYKEADNFLKASREALDQKNQLPYFKQEYEASDRSLKNTIDYCGKLKKSGNYNLARDVAVSRLSDLKEKEKYTQEEWILLTNYITDYSSPLFKEVVIHKKEYNQVSGSEAFRKYLHFVLGSTYIYHQNTMDSGATRIKYLAALQDLKKYVAVDYYIARAEYFFHLEDNDELVFKYAANFLDKDYELDYDDGKFAYYLAYMANRYIDKEGSRFEAASRWAAKAISLDSTDYKGFFLLSRVHYRNGKYEQALLLAQKALALEKNKTEAGVIKNLFKAETIGEFINQIKAKLEKKSES